MTKNELQWLSHFLRRVVTHNHDEVEMLWHLVTKIESQSQCVSIRPTGGRDELDAIQR